MIQATGEEEKASAEESVSPCANRRTLPVNGPRTRAHSSERGLERFGSHAHLEEASRAQLLGQLGPILGRDLPVIRLVALVADDDYRRSLLAELFLGVNDASEDCLEVPEGWRDQRSRSASQSFALENRERDLSQRARHSHWAEGIA